MVIGTEHTLGGETNPFTCLFLSHYLESSIGIPVCSGKLGALLFFQCLAIDFLVKFLRLD